MKNTKINAALLAVTALCLSVGCSEKNSTDNGYEKPQTTVTAAADTADTEAEAEEWAYSLTASNDSQLDISRLDSFEVSSGDLHGGRRHGALAGRADERRDHVHRADGR